MTPDRLDDGWDDFRDGHLEIVGYAVAAVLVAVALAGAYAVVRLGTWAIGRWS